MTPFTVPHIVVSEPPPQNPWIAYDNRPSDPQDSQWGARLTVPANHVTVVNQPPGETEADVESEPDSEFGDEEAHAEFINYVTSLRFEPPPVISANPLTTEDSRELFFADESVHDEGGEFASFLGDASSSQIEEGLAVISCDELSQTGFMALDDDDDLPPFDEWYTSVQSRMESS